MAYDVGANKLITYGQTAMNVGEIWHGSVQNLAQSTGVPANLVLVSGNNQTGSVGQSLASPLTVQVTDASGNPVPGIAVLFTVASGGGTLTASSVTTNGSGLASSVLTLGPSAGANSVTVTSGTLAGSPVTFSATSTSTITSRCDLNGDGVVDSVDVQSAIDQTMGKSTCGSADLVGSGTCTVVGVQRVIAASLGGTCRIGN